MTQKFRTLLLLPPFLHIEDSSGQQRETVPVQLQDLFARCTLEGVQQQMSLRGDFYLQVRSVRVLEVW